MRAMTKMKLFAVFADAREFQEKLFFILANAQVYSSFPNLTPKGSIKYIHSDCLITWISHSKSKFCELCKTPYAFQPGIQYPQFLT
jgi:hypothetical protein